jgi:hypothetical protein
MRPSSRTARHRALRAAFAVTVSVCFGGSGCGAATAAPAVCDVPACDGVCPPGDHHGPQIDPDCCAEWGGSIGSDGSCAVPGPFVPPAA